MFQRICFSVRRGFVAGLIVAMASASGFAQAPTDTSTTFKGFIDRDYISGYYLLDSSKGTKTLVNESGQAGAIRITNVVATVGGVTVYNGPATVDGFFGTTLKGWRPQQGGVADVIVTVTAQYRAPDTFVRDEMAPGGLRLVERGATYPFAHSYKWPSIRFPVGRYVVISMDEPSTPNPRVTALGCSLPPAVVQGAGLPGNIGVIVYR
jgi:hypothetical protein